MLTTDFDCAIRLAMRIVPAPSASTPERSGTMSANPNQRQSTVEKPRQKVRDLPGCIKYILLLFLLILLFAEIYAGEFQRFPEVSWLIWLILIVKLILIILLIILIWVQRQLNCEITAPSGCATTEYDAANDRLIIRVIGTASGTVFGHYTLAVSGTPIPVIYPGGGSSGIAPVTGGELGQLDISGMEPTTGLVIVLTVFPSGAGGTRTCTKTFDIQRRMVYITKVGGVPAQVMGTHPVDSSEPLKLVKANALPATPEASLASVISVEGGADVYGCGRQMSEYVLQYQEVASPNPPWQQDELSGWTNINAPLPFGDTNHPRTYSYLGTLLPNYVLNGKLTLQWVLRSILQTVFPTTTFADRWITEELGWNTTPLNGRFTVRLRVQHQPLIGLPDPTPPELYDTATVWMDNRPIDGKITHMAIAGGGGLGVCDELVLSQFVQTAPAVHKINAEIIGRAWDPIILNSYPVTDHPNDNFDSYLLQFKKDGGSVWTNIINSTTRVPNILQETPLPALPAGTGVLASWDIVGALDAGPLPPGIPPDPYPKIYRGQRCAYVIELYVSDTTHVGDAGSPHEIRDSFPFCIVNDLKNNFVFPVPS